jgi:hypothetical protein
MCISLLERDPFAAGLSRVYSAMAGVHDAGHHHHLGRVGDAP